MCSKHTPVGEAALAAGFDASASASYAAAVNAAYAAAARAIEDAAYAAAEDAAEDAANVTYAATARPPDTPLIVTAAVNVANCLAYAVGDAATTVDNWQTVWDKYDPARVLNALIDGRKANPTTK